VAKRLDGWRRHFDRSSQLLLSSCKLPHPYLVSRWDDPVGTSQGLWRMAFVCMLIRLLCLVVLIKRRLVTHRLTDRRTDIWTQDHSISSHTASRGKKATQSLQNGWFGVDRGHSRQCWSADMRQQHLQRHMVARHTIQSCSVTLNVYYILGQQKLSWTQTAKFTFWRTNNPFWLNALSTAADVACGQKV